MVLGLLWCNVGFAWSAKGGKSCGFVISKHEDDSLLNRTVLVSRLNGYITGRNYETNGRVGKGVDNDSLYYALLKYCRENPLKSNIDAEQYIYEQLK